MLCNSLLVDPLQFHKQSVAKFLWEFMLQLYTIIQVVVYKQTFTLVDAIPAYKLSLAQKIEHSSSLHSLIYGCRKILFASIVYVFELVVFIFCSLSSYVPTIIYFLFFHAQNCFTISVVTSSSLSHSLTYTTHRCCSIFIRQAIQTHYLLLF